ncbi:MAG: TadE/TadG family type IV pilus assembly protein, partial [Alteraurantiacibacter sp.]
RRLPAFLHRLRRDERGVTIVEFAIIAPVFLLMLVGLFDFGFQIYAQSVMNGAMQAAGRDSTLEPGGPTAAELDASVSDKVLLVVPSANVAFTRSNYENFTDVRQPERFDDTDGDGTCNNGEPFEDVNGNGTYDLDRGMSGQGGADDAVLYEATASYKRMFPMAEMIGIGKDVEIYGATILRNQPFADQAERNPEVVNCP